MRNTLILSSFILTLTVLFVGCSGYGSDYTEEIFSSDSYSYNSSSSYKGSSSSTKGSSSSSENGSCSSESDPDLDESSSSEEIKSVPDLEFDKNLNATVKLDSVWYKGNYTKTIQVGNFIWTIENANEYPTWKTSKCYDVDKSYCEKYGYLYREWDSKTLCPDSFSIASTTAWESLLDNVGSSLKYIKSSTLWNGSANGSYALNLVPGGTCTGITCTDAGKKAYYIGVGNSNNDSKIYIIGDDGYTIKPASEFTDSSYFSVRCVKETFQVLKGSDLSSCDTKNKVWVQEDSSTYTCVYGKWFKEVFREPECSKATEGATYYKNRPYVCDNGEWREINELEARIGYCTKASQRDTIAYKDTMYICDSLSWRKRTLTDAHGTCTDTNAGDSVYYEGNNYVCKDNYWRTLNNIETKFGVCTKERFGEVIFDNAYYNVCKNYEWQVTYEPEDVYGKCDTTKTDSVYTVVYYNYVCKGGSWVTANAKEIAFGVCNGKTQGTVKHTDTTTYVCDKGIWRIASVEEAMGNCSAALQDTIYVADGTTYACNNLQWQKLTVPVSSFPYCTKKNNGAKKISSSKYYICEDYVWKQVDMPTYYYGECNEKIVNDIWHSNKDSLGYKCALSSGTYSWVRATIVDESGECTTAIQDSVYRGYVCDDGKWRTLTAFEKKNGKCTQKNTGDLLAAAGYYYQCVAAGWVTIEEEDYNVYQTPCNEDNDSLVIKTKASIYLCSNNKWGLFPTTSEVKCQSDEDDGKLAVSNGRLTSCYYRYTWRTPEDEEVIYQHGICTQKRNGMIVPFNNEFKICNNGTWQFSTFADYLKSKPCNETVTTGGIEYACKNNVWAPIYGTMKDSRDGQTYRTLKAGEQTWMVDNLNYETENSWCFANANTQEECAVYGRYYTWKNVKDACPKGWHVPDAYEFKKLRYVPKIQIKDMDYWQSTEYDQSVYKGFELRGTGIRNTNGTYEYANRVGGFWYADSVSATTAFVEFYGVTSAQTFTTSLDSDHYNPKDSESPFTYIIDQNMGVNIRCVKDE
jgi:uncharacterized protein (TIGR02145 family)